MKSILFSILLTGGLAAPAFAETLTCTFDVADRYREWVPSQITLIRDRDYGRDRVSADIFRQSGLKSIPANLTINNDKRTTFKFQHRNPKLRHRERHQSSALDTAKYTLTIYSNDRPAMLKAKVILHVNHLYQTQYETTRVKGECLEK